MPDRACVEDALWEILLVAKNHAVVLDAHVTAVSGHWLEQLESLFITLRLNLHPLWCHQRGLLDVCALSLFVAVPPVHGVRVHCEPPVDLGYHSDCLLVGQRLLLHALEVIVWLVEESQVVRHRVLVVLIPEIAGLRVEAAATVVEVVLVLRHVIVCLRHDDSTPCRPRRLQAWLLVFGGEHYNRGAAGCGQG